MPSESGTDTVVQLSIVATMYNSSRYVEEFVRRTQACAEELVDRFEIILVDDGSPDMSLDIARNLAAENERVRVVELSRNHGHHRAMMTGLAHTRGDLVYLTDIDLEERPENLSRFWEALEQDPDLDVIYGQQTERNIPWRKKAFSQLFYTLFNAFSEVKISDRELVSRLMRRRFVDALLRYQEESIFLPALWTSAGFKQKPIVAEKSFDGISSYSLRRRVHLAIDAVTSFSALPLVFVFYMGVGLSLFSGTVIAYLVVNRLLFETPLQGWTSLIASVFLMGGLVLCALGIIGLYISKVFIEVKARPRSLVRAIHEKNPSHEATD